MVDLALAKLPASMPRRLDASAPGFAADFETLLADRDAVTDDVSGVVRDILEDVRARGDEALIDYTKRFDRLDLAKTGIRFADDEIAKAALFLLSGASSFMTGTAMLLPIAWYRGPSAVALPLYGTSV